MALSTGFATMLLEVAKFWYLSIFFLLVGRMLWNRWYTGLNHIPGPLLQSLTQLPRVYQVWTGRIHEYDLQLHQKYGAIVRIGPKLVSIADRNEINKIYGVSTKFYKSSFYDPSTPYDDEGIVPDPFVLKDKDMHSRMKRNAANAYALSSLIQLEPYINETLTELFTLLDRAATNPENVVDLGAFMHAFAMDAIFMINFGKSLNILRKGDELQLLASFDKIMPYMATIGQVPWLHKYLAGNRYGAKVILGNMTFEDGLMELANSRVVNFRKNLQDRPDDAPCTFTQRLLLNQKSNPKSLTDREILTHALGNITAGSDTTSITLRSIFYYTLRHPNSYHQLCEEVRSKCPFPASFASAQNLPYLNAVIKEALRLHPPMALMLGRTVPTGGANLCGYQVPEGTECGIPAWVIHRDPNVFPEPESWRPERWITTAPEHLTQMNRAFFAFGSGMHTCSGRHISMMEITKLVPSLLLRYEFELVYPNRPWVFKTTMLTPQKGIYVRVKRRFMTDKMQQDR